MSRLVWAAGLLADFGHEVTCVDKDTGKIAVAIARGEVPIYEPGLNDLVAANTRAGRLKFTADLPGAVKRRRLAVAFIAVGHAVAPRQTVMPT